MKKFKKRTIIDIFLIFLLLGILIFLGTLDYSKEKKDNKKFDQEFSMVSSDNVFKYIDDEETLKKLQSGNSIIFMGFKENEWANYYAKILNDVAKENNIKEIYYYNFFGDRSANGKNYRKIVDILLPYLKKDDEGKVKITSPSLIMIKDGYIFAFDDETSYVNGTMKPKDYWHEENINNKKTQLNDILKVYLGGNDNGGEN